MKIKEHIMKIIKYNLSTVLLLFVFFASINLYSQNQVMAKTLFVRVIDIEGKKVGKGYVRVATDSTLELSRSNEYRIIPLKNIGYIKTKRSAGHNVLTGAITGASIGVILGVATAEPDKILGYTAGEGAVAFGSLGFIGGAALGGIVSAIKNSVIFFIDGDKNKWELFRKVLQ